DHEEVEEACWLTARSVPASRGASTRRGCRRDVADGRAAGSVRARERANDPDPEMGRLVSFARCICGECTDGSPRERPGRPSIARAVAGGQRARPRWCPAWPGAIK